MYSFYSRNCHRDATVVGSLNSSLKILQLCSWIEQTQVKIKLTQLKGSMQEPDNFHFYCFEKNAAKVFNPVIANKVLTKLSKSINRVFGSTCTKICINSDILIYLVLARNHGRHFTTHNQQVSKISRIYLVIAPEMSTPGETYVAYYSDFWYRPSLDKSNERRASIIHINMVVEKCLQKNDVSSVDLIFA